MVGPFTVWVQPETDTSLFQSLISVPGHSQCFTDMRAAKTIICFRVYARKQPSADLSCVLNPPCLFIVWYLSENVGLCIHSDRICVQCTQFASASRSKHLHGNLCNMLHPVTSWSTSFHFHGTLHRTFRCDRRSQDQVGFSTPPTTSESGTKSDISALSFNNHQGTGPIFQGPSKVVLIQHCQWIPMRYNRIEMTCSNLY